MTLTTEQLIAIAEEELDACTTLDAAKLMASEILANREAQPVAYTEQCEISNMQATGLYLRGFPDNSQGRNIPLYTAQPAPAVPEQITAANAPEVFEIASEVERLGLRGTYGAYAAGWNACCAAMLAQPVSSGYTLPPHVYRELVNSLRDTAVKFSGTEQLRERLNTALSQFIEPDHPHTRTVAPVGGN